MIEEAKHIQKWIIELEKENEELKRENERLKTGVDVTKPQPCTKFRGATTTEWIAKLVE